MPTAHKTRVWLGVLVAIVIGVAIAAVMMRRSEPPPAAGQTPPPSLPPATPAQEAQAPAPVEYVNDRLRREIETQGLTVDRARELFVVEVMTLPGVTAPAGPARPSISGTYALARLQAVKDQLTPDQQAVLRELLDATHSVLPKDAPALPHFEPPPTLRPAAYVLDDDEQQKAAKLAYFHQIYDWANGEVSALTGQPKIAAFKLAIKEFTSADPDTMKAWALTTT